MVKQILGEVLEELEKTAGQVVKQTGQAVTGVASDAVKQVTGVPSSGQDQGSAWEQVVGKPMKPRQYRKLQSAEEIEKQKTLEETRRRLKEMMQPSKPPVQEPPPYIKAKVEKRQQMVELEKKAKKKLPSPDIMQAKMKGGGTGERKGWAPSG